MTAPIRTVLFMITALSTACTAVKPPHEPLTPSVASKPSTSLTHWQLIGKMAVSEAQHGFSAGVNWQQMGPSAARIALYGGLGTRPFVLSFDPNGATLREGNQSVSDKDAVSLMRAHTGYLVPLPQLFFWVRGLPTPEGHQSDHQQHDTINQLGWQITVTHWRSVNGFRLPDNLIATHGQLKIKLIIKQWVLPS